MEDVSAELQKLGLHYRGNERLICGLTGKMIPAQVFMGPIYYQRLKHMVEDKIHLRARGQMQIMEHQPLSGRSRNGGLRYVIPMPQHLVKQMLVSNTGGNTFKLRESPLQFLITKRDSERVSWLWGKLRGMVIILRRG